MKISTEQLNIARELITAAVQLHQEDKLEQAEELYCQTLDVIPEFTLAHFNLARIYFDQEKFSRAAHHYNEAARQQPDDIDIIFNLGLSLKKAGDLEEAAATYCRGLELCPDDPELHYNLALTQQTRHKYNEAIKGYQQAIDLDPDYAPAHNNLGFLFHRQGRLAEAAQVYKKLIEIGHNTTSARHMLAALEGETTSSAPLEYVQEIFDNYSDNYDNNLINDLGYNTPALLRSLLLETIDKPRSGFSNCLDLGCGTGLSGAAFADLSRQITGIDISNGMLESAAKKNIYQALHQSEIVNFLETCDKQFDLILATDVFVYLGDLSPVFQAAKKAAQPSAFFLFSTEKTEKDYKLQPTGRYAHSIAYIKALSLQYEFMIIKWQETKIRKEKGEWIIGNLFLLQTDKGLTHK